MKTKAEFLTALHKAKAGDRIVYCVTVDNLVPRELSACVSECVAKGWVMGFQRPDRPASAEGQRRFEHIAVVTRKWKE